MITDVDFSIYLRGLELIARNLKLKSFSKDEARDWLINCKKCGGLYPLEEVQKQWEQENPEEYEDPFGILTFWADQRQAEWDSSQSQSPRFPSSGNEALGYSLLMNNIRHGLPTTKALS